MSDDPPSMPSSHGDEAVSPAGGEALGQTLGRYKLRERIGEGGYGVVYVAEQEEPIRRRVALKVIKLGMDTRSVIARFDAERQALARMDHPNIAKVLDAGSTEAGRPYFVMELVRGIRITDYCDQHNLSTRQRLELFIPVCHAIQHAHQKGIIHRDLKPSNILVTLHDSVPVPKVIDFGIAKATEGRLTDATVYTQMNQFIGTPAYMSPEQAEMSGLDVDTRSDLYSLGVVLYELLTGRTPFDGKELAAAGIDAMRWRLRETEPPRPSTRLASLKEQELNWAAKHRSAEAPKLISLLKGDLDWIVMKCLEKDRTRRYETANGLALDIERHLNNEPVVARPPTTAYRLTKFVRRNKVMVGAAGLVAAVLLLGILVSTWQAARAMKESQRARANEELARRHLYAADMNLAQQALAQNNMGRAQALLNGYRPKSGERDLRGWEWRYLQRQCRSDESKTLWTHANYITGVAFSPDGTRLAAQAEDGEVRLWSLRTESEVPGWKLNASWADWMGALAFAPDGTLATANNLKGVQTWDIESQKPVHNYPAELNSELVGFAFAPTGGRLAIGQTNGIIRLWDTATGRPGDLLTNGPGRWRMALEFSPDGRLLAAGGAEFKIRIWDLASMQLVHFLTNRLGEAVGQWNWDWVVSLAFSPDGKTLASGGWDEAIKLWDVATGQLKTNLAEGIGRIEKIVFSPDGSTLAAASTDYSIRLWSNAPPTYAPIARLQGHLNEIWSLAFSTNGQTLATGGKDKTVRLWDARPRSKGTPRLEFELSDFISRPSPDGRWFASVTTNGAATLWDASTLRERVRIETGVTNTPGATVSPNGSTLAVGTTDGRVRFWDLDSRREEPGFSGLAKSVLPIFSPDGRTLLTVVDRSTAKLWDLTTRRETADLKLNNKGLYSVEFSPDGRSLALGLWDRETARETLGLWDIVNRSWINQVEGRWYGIGRLAFSPDGKRLASALTDGTARIWNLPDFQSDLPALKGPVMSMDCVGFSPDGKRLVTGGDHGIVQLWDTETGQQVGTLEAQEKACLFTFFPNDDSIVTVGWEGRKSKKISAILWRASSLDEIRMGEGHHASSTRASLAQ